MGTFLSPKATYQIARGQKRFAADLWFRKKNRDAECVESNGKCDTFGVGNGVA
jgi:hypothetical protein